MSDRPLAIIPTFMRQAQDVLLLEDCLVTMRATAGERVDILVVDDHSPEADLVDGARELCKDADARMHVSDSNEGFARTVNVGLAECEAEYRDAILVNADIAFDHGSGWIDAFEEAGEGVMGGLLLYPNGTIQHAGIYFSMLTRMFDHIYHYGPGNLPEAQFPRRCPVTGALQFISRHTIAKIGLYDPEFRLGFEDVDYCIRAWQAGEEVVYNPRAIAVHHESYFRSRPTSKIANWQQGSWLYFAQKYAGVSFAEFVPSLALGEAR